MSAAKLREYEYLVKTTLAPLQSARVAEAARAGASAASLHARAEALSALCAHPGPSPYRPMVDLGLGVSVAAEVDAAQPLLVDVGAGVHLAMAPREALLYSRMAAAEARSRHALAEKALHDVSRDLESACEALLMLQRLQADEGQGSRGEGQ